MIYTVTLNPSIDYIMHVSKMNLGKTNRSTSEQFYLGGKGINVSIILNELSQDSIALGFLGGFSGEYIEQELAKYQHIQSNFVLTNQPSRINVKLKGLNESEINGIGPTISPVDEQILTEIICNLSDAACVVLAGSVAQGMMSNWYTFIASVLHDKGIPFVVDIDSNELFDLLKYQPLLIKPNQDELESLFNTPCTNETVQELATELHCLGAKHVIVSRGALGAIMVSKEGVFCASNPPGKLVNSVGAGDSMVAGFVHGYLETNSALDAFKLSIACGSATAYLEHLGTKQKIYELIEQIEIRIEKGRS